MYYYLGRCVYHHGPVLPLRLFVAETNARRLGAQDVLGRTGHRWECLAAQRVLRIAGTASVEGQSTDTQRAIVLNEDEYHDSQPRGPQNCSILLMRFLT